MKLTPHERLYHAQDGKCHWCGWPMLLNRAEKTPLAVTIDHLRDRQAVPPAEHRYNHGISALGSKRGKCRPYQPVKTVGAHRICNNSRHNDLEVPVKAIQKVIRAMAHLPKEDEAHQRLNAGQLESLEAYKIADTKTFKEYKGKP